MVTMMQAGESSRQIAIFGERRGLRRLSLRRASDSYGYGRHADRHILAGLNADQHLPGVREALEPGGRPQLLVGRPHALRIAEELSDTGGPALVRPASTRMRVPDGDRAIQIRP